MNDSWSSEEPTAIGSRPDPDVDTAERSRRSDRHASEVSSSAPPTEPPARRERYPWVGLAFLVAGLAAGGIGLATIALELDRPGTPQVGPARWWLVVGGVLAVAWSIPWFLRPRGRRRAIVVVGVCTAAVLAAALLMIPTTADTMTGTRH